jgi:hypothetical protein
MQAFDVRQMFNQKPTSLRGDVFDQFEIKYVEARGKIKTIKTLYKL